MTVPRDSSQQFLFRLLFRAALCSPRRRPPSALISAPCSAPLRAESVLISAHGGSANGFGAAALNTSGDRVLTAGVGKDYRVRLWETATGRELHRWEESRGTVMGLAFSTDSRTVVEWGADGVARSMKAEGSYEPLSRVGSRACAGPGSIAQARLSDDGERVITIGRTARWMRGMPERRTDLTFTRFPKGRSCLPARFRLPSSDPR